MHDVACNCIFYYYRADITILSSFGCLVCIFTLFMKVYNIYDSVFF